MSKANGVILYEGASRIDGVPIIAIATWNSKNAKTGDMIQTWIIRSDMKPQDAINLGLDFSVCGDCKLRPANKVLRNALGIKRGCYVKAYNAPRSVYEAYCRGRYDTDLSRVPDIKVRLGSYGDPCAVPLKVWKRLIAIHDQAYTGYTHQWRYAKNEAYKAFVMASVDTASEALKAIKKGYRLFAVDHGTGEYKGFLNMAQCPASKEAGALKTCVECTACNGAPNGNKRASIIIEAH